MTPRRRPNMPAAKRAKRALRAIAAPMRDSVVASMPEGLRHRLAPTGTYLDMLLFDHVLIRTVFPNRHKLRDGVWRSAQPLPYQIRRLARDGVRTIVNLRGQLDQATYALEKQSCARHGITLVDYRIRSRDAPSRGEILGICDLFGRLERPVLFHCKSGADRVGLVSALYLHVVEGVPIAEARSQLSLKYGHFRQADTGILDGFFERYLADTMRAPMPFLTWVEKVYDSVELKRSFRAQGWANRLVVGILHRE